jgi:membrane protein DedA with SNARE-associated domain
VEQTLRFLAAHGYLLLFVVGFVEQIGLPFPALPVLLAAGALIAGGELSAVGAVAVLVVSALVADLLWYRLGRTRGMPVLSLICRVSLEPDSCVRRTENLFARLGARGLVLSKFVPGLNTAAPPLAGVFGMRLGCFLLYDTAGAILWAVTSLTLGYLFSDQLQQVLSSLSRVGGSVGTAALVLLAGYVVYKFLQRRRFLARLQIDRITPEELHDKIARGEDLTLVDLRHAVEFEADPESLPGAVRMTPEEVEARAAELPTDRDVVFYCT